MEGEVLSIEAIGGYGRRALAEENRRILGEFMKRRW
jgi:hypothetical protein